MDDPRSASDDQCSYQRLLERFFSADDDSSRRRSGPARHPPDPRPYRGPHTTPVRSPEASARAQRREQLRSEQTAWKRAGAPLGTSVLSDHSQPETTGDRERLPATAKPSSSWRGGQLASLYRAVP